MVRPMLIASGDLRPLWHLWLKIREIEKLFLATGCPEDQKVDIATYYLKDEADNWCALTRARMEVQPGYGWTVFSEALKKRFYPEEMRWQKKQEFLRLQQGSMTVEEYTNKFVKLSGFVTFVTMDEVSKTRCFEKNLTPKQAYDRALSIYDSVLSTEVEESAKNKFMKRPYVAPSTSQKKQKYEARPYTPRDQGQAKKDWSCYKCGKAYHPGTTCATGAPLTCYTCKASGHKSVDCPQKPKVDAPKADAPKAGRVFVMSRAEADVIRAMVEWESPKNVNEVRSFLGLAGYYRQFVHDFSKIARPMTQLMKKESKFIWTEACEAAFQELKKRLTTAPVLTLLEEGVEFDETWSLEELANDYQREIIHLHGVPKDIVSKE
ncbi:uncharacterized protein LOC141649458 [Silene latifolia]|uniref:uncharacterized protein LOC141649458 n=1 Tax=Silene latifolia TaxID=37657 RepID=UPI003D788617